MLETRIGAASKTISLFLVFHASILVTLVITSYWNGRDFLWRTDGGYWLKHANAILGQTYPMWNEGTYQYPPLFFVILAAIVKITGDPLLSIKLLAQVCFFIFPLAMCLLSKKIYRSIYAEILAVWLTAVYPLFLKFVGRGGYPNILGFALLAIALYYTVRFAEQDLRNGVVASIFILVVIMTHGLTSLISPRPLMLWPVLSVVFGGAQSKSISMLLSIALFGFLLYRLVLVWPPNQNTSDSQRIKRIHFIGNSV